MVNAAYFVSGTAFAMMAVSMFLGEFGYALFFSGMSLLATGLAVIWDDER